MTNILPQESQKEMLELSRARFVIITSVIFIAASLLAYGALLPSYLVLHFNPGPVTVPSTVSPVEIANDKTALIHSQNLLNMLAPVVAPVTPSAAIRTALSLRPQGVHIDHISYQAGKSGQIVLQGVADTTDAIDAYRTALLTSKQFSAVDVPVGVLIGSDNGRFDVRLSGSF